MKYNYFELDITLNKLGYNYDDMNCLFHEPFVTSYKTKIGFQWQPGAVDIESINMLMLFKLPLSIAASAILAEISKDLYEWVKESFSKVISKKNSFAESKIILSFDNVTITIYVNNKDDLLYCLVNIEFILKQLAKMKLDSYDMELNANEVRIILGE